ncbi:MAG: hypothetical protein IPJ43_10015 [Saprospiraceae bacterium]|nr:hypothetical protein [Saprospiraceae bacterium]
MNSTRFILCFLFLFAAISAQDLSTFVDPRIGTDAHGHTFPGPTMPF